MYGRSNLRFDATVAYAMCKNVEGTPSGMTGYQFRRPIILVMPWSDLCMRYSLGIRSVTRLASPLECLSKFTWALLSSAAQSFLHALSGEVSWRWDVGSYSPVIDCSRASFPASLCKLRETFLRLPHRLALSLLSAPASPPPKFGQTDNNAQPRPVQRLRRDTAS